VLVARADNAGDVLLAGPAVRAAAAAGGAVHLLCGPRGRAAAELLPGVSSIVEARLPWIDPDPLPVRRADASVLVDQVEALGVERAAVLTSSHQSPLPLALLLRWAGVPRIAAVSHEYPGSLLDHRIPGDPDVHEVRRALLVTEALGLPVPDDDRLRVDLTAPAGEAAAGCAGGAVAGVTPGPDLVVVHPGASVPARTLAPCQWHDVVRAVAATGRSVAVTGTGEESRLTAAVSGEQPHVFDLGGKTTLRELGRLVAGAGAFVGGNTGPLHLAAAVGTPAVAVFPPTVPLARWRPWRVPHVVLGDQAVACAGCRSRTCPLPEQICVSQVGPGDVVAAIEHLAGVRSSGATER
jgi:ADP-heptose:LPS heptosyltransferase